MYAQANFFLSRGTTVHVGMEVVIFDYSRLAL